jgi:hypothetical protein
MGQLAIIESARVKEANNRQSEKGDAGPTDKFTDRTRLPNCICESRCD